MESVIDLTDAADTPEPKAVMGRAPRTVTASVAAGATGPIGNDISADVVDLASSDSEDLQNSQTETMATTSQTSINRPVQKHPRKIIAESKKRKRERMAAKLAEEKKARARAIAENGPGGCNFVIIDDSSSEDERETEQEVDEAQKKPPGRERGRQKKTSESSAASVSNSQDYWRPQGFRQDREFNYQISQEAALEMQERMFREAAERVARMQASEPSMFPSVHASPRFSVPTFDVAQRHPDHWQWRDPHACLGLPRDASLTLVKSQYRRLARLYHPDKSNHADASNKFHGIAKAYRKLSQGE